MGFEPTITRLKVLRRNRLPTVTIALDKGVHTEYELNYSFRYTGADPRNLPEGCSQP